MLKTTSIVGKHFSMAALTSNIVLDVTIPKKNIRQLKSADQLATYANVAGPRKGHVEKS